jgi:hypothetical protein
VDLVTQDHQKVENVDGPVIVVVYAPDPPKPPPHPCTVGRHRPAWLVSGGLACGYCGRPL